MFTSDKLLNKPFITKRSVADTALLLVFLLISFSVYSQADQKRQLQNQKEQIEREIRENNRLLQQTRQAQRSGSHEVVLIQNQIKARGRLISNINGEIVWLDREIRNNEREIARLGAELERLRDDYARMIYAAYKTRHSHNRLMYVFSAESFNQASRRIRYFQQYNQHRRNQAVLIVQTRQELEERRKGLDEQRKEKVLLLADKERERSSLNNQRRERETVVRTLKTRENQLLAEIRKKQSEARTLNRRIEEIIAKEMEASRRKAGTDATAKPGTFALTPEEAALSNSFEANRGKLPWPTERGVVSEHFGRRKHDFLDIIIENNGINILTAQNQDARAVFRGTVRYVINVANLNAVLIRHGEFFTLYSNLSEVYVKNGDVVDTKQKLGRIYHDRAEGKTELHFEIWKGSTKLNPIHWLAGQR